VVLGPSRDGGYYLIGLKAPEPALFEGMEWGSDTVCAATRDRIRRLGLSVTLLPEMEDVDRFSDVVSLRRKLETETTLRRLERTRRVIERMQDRLWMEARNGD